MIKKKTHKLGRKPAEDPKQIIRLYVNKSTIKKLGGVESIRDLAYTVINEKAFPII